MQIPTNKSRNHFSKEQPDGLNFSQKPKKYSSPDQGLLDEYTGVALKYAELRREIRILRIEMGEAVKLLEELWLEGGDLKATVVEKLRLALSRLDPFK
jgi:hypothetical protein